MQTERTLHDELAEANAGKIEPVSFKIEYIENGTPDEWPEAHSWEEINEQINEIRAHIRSEYGPTSAIDIKTDIRVTFADGHSYITQPHPNLNQRGEPLQKHIRRYVGYASGLVKPYHLTDEDYAGHLNMIGEPQQAYWYFIARDYAVGVATPEDRKPAPYGVWVIEADGADGLVFETPDRAEAHNKRREFAEEAAGSGDAYEVWRDGEQDPDPSADDYAYTVEPGFRRYAAGEYADARRDAEELSRPERFGLAVVHAQDGEIIARFRDGFPVERYPEADETTDPTLAADVLAFLQWVEEATPNGDIQAEARELAERMRGRTIS